MPPLRPITRLFPRPSITNRTPALLSITAYPSHSSPSASTIGGQTNVGQAVTGQKNFSNSARKSAGAEQQYDPPTGWLFGVKPGEKYQEEGWEKVWTWGFCGSLAVAVVAYAYKPDTSIQTWALEEARRRLEAEGILPDPDTVGRTSESN